MAAHMMRLRDFIGEQNLKEAKLRHDGELEKLSKEFIKAIPPSPPPNFLLGVGGVGGTE